MSPLLTKLENIVLTMSFIELSFYRFIINKEEGPNPGQRQLNHPSSVVPGLPGNTDIYILFIQGHGFCR